jgi:hypothetical protein
VGTVEFEPILIGDDPPVGSGGEGIIVGADPLATKDGDTSYVQTQLTGASVATSVSFRLPSDAHAAPGARVWITAEAKMITGFAGLYLTATLPGEASGIGITNGDIDGFSGTYSTQTEEIEFGFLPAGYAPQYLIDPDTVFHMLNTSQLGGLGVLRTTWLRVVVESLRPLRQWPLDEGNGGSPRRYGGRSTSRSTSGNARGYQ